MALKVLVGPLRYVQGPDALLQMGEQLKVLGIVNPLILASPSGRKAVEYSLTEGLRAKGIRFAFIDFGGECTWKEIERVKLACIQGGHDAIVSCGGGKTLDTGRSAAAGSAVNVEKLPPEVFPRFGANVAVHQRPHRRRHGRPDGRRLSHLHGRGHSAIDPCLSNQSDDGLRRYSRYRQRSPVRLLVAGMGDALATFFEADVSRRTGTASIQTGAHSTLAAQALGRLCLDILLDYGVQAMAEAGSGVAGPAIEAIAEANVLLSGLGWENGGLSAAHAVGLAFHHIHDSFEASLLHGELVAFGTLTQLVAEGRKARNIWTRFSASARRWGCPRHSRRWVSRISRMKT